MSENVRNTDAPTRRKLLKMGMVGLLTPLARAVPATVTLRVEGGSLEISFQPGPVDLPRAQLMAWIERAARAVSNYFGHYPVHVAHIDVSIVSGHRGVSDGRSYGKQGSVSAAFCQISVGQHSTPDDLRNDWILTHEMVHFGFPSVPRRQHWMEEGSATYIEPIARGRVGELTAKQVWGDMFRDMHQGLPEDNRGLNDTHTWGSTYWGGALFWLRADVGIRKKTSNRKGLEHAFRAINNAHGNISQDWDVRRVLEAGAAATDGETLTRLYDEMANRPARVDLASLWNDLGVHRRAGEIVLDDKAPLAAVRNAIL